MEQEKKGMEKNLTGLASIDKPWLKYYRKTPLREFNVNQTMSDLLREANKDNLDFCALNYMGLKGNYWTYREIFALADRLADAYKQHGIKENDTVLILTISGIEEALNLIALNQIGAVSKWIDITSSPDKIKQAIEDDKCKMVVCFAAVVPALLDFVDDVQIEKILYVHPKRYIRPAHILTHGGSINELRLLGKESLPAMPDSKKFMEFSSFIKLGRKNVSPRTNYEKERPAIKIQSSGTTGKPKVIVHTNYSINHSIKKFSNLDLPLYPQKVLLKTAPAWVGYGLINTLAVGLAYGMEVMMTPLLQNNLLVQFNEKYDVAFAVPLHYRYLADNLDKIETMTRPLALISGGDKISKGEIEEFERLYQEKGCKAHILNGAGNNEILGAGCVNPMSSNRPGSVGLPMCGDTISVFLPDTVTELKMGEVGEICYKTTSAFLCYQDDKEKTDKVKRKHGENEIWIHTGDLGYQDAEGFLYIQGRLERVITVGGFKIASSEIEEVIQKNPLVKECVVVALQTAQDGDVPVAFISLKDENKKEEVIMNEIDQLCNQYLKERARPKFKKLISKIPYTSNNKQDFLTLENMAKDLYGGLE